MHFVLHHPKLYLTGLLVAQLLLLKCLSSTRLQCFVCVNCLRNCVEMACLFASSFVTPSVSLKNDLVNISRYIIARIGCCFYDSSCVEVNFNRICIHETGNDTFDEFRNSQIRSCRISSVPIKSRKVLFCRHGRLDEEENHYKSEFSEVISPMCW